MVAVSGNGDQEGSPAPIAEPLDKETLLARVSALGVDLVGFARVEALEVALPAELRPSTIATEMATLVVLAKRTLRGVLWSKHLPSKQLAGGRTLRELDRIAERVALTLEEHGHVSLPVSSAALDFERRNAHDVTPAGQGSTLLRHGAVEAGLGTWGLSRMVLTQAYGPRIYLAGVLTRLELEGDVKLDGELCLGLERCGRCAAVCPEDAIPRRAPQGAELATIRNLDAAACARSSQPFGFQAFTDHLAEIARTLDRGEMWTRMRSRKTGEIWSEMAMMKEGALTGCSECTQVCPVGEDYARLAASPHRRDDLPDKLPHTVVDGVLQVENLGPQIRRRTTWEREGER